MLLSEDWFPLLSCVRHAATIGVHVLPMDSKQEEVRCRSIDG